MPLLEHTPNDGRSFVGDVSIDDEESCPHLLAREHVQQIRSCRRIRSIVIREIHGSGNATRHMPHSTIARRHVEEKRCRCGMREGEESHANQRKDPNHPDAGCVGDCAILAFIWPFYARWIATTPCLAELAGLVPERPHHLTH